MKKKQFLNLLKQYNDGKFEVDPDDGMIRHVSKNCVICPIEFVYAKIYDKIIDCISS